MTFTTLCLSEALVRAVHEKGYTTPSPIQIKAVPAILDGGDVMASAETGTGKTAGFVLPLLHRLSLQQSRTRSMHTRVLVLTPTRELAAQVHASIVDYGKYLNLRSAVVFGGVGINPQIGILRRGVDILVATPGRLLDLYKQQAIQFGEVNTLVLDEADRMLDMGFIHDIKRILSFLPRKRQNLLFSATFSTEIRQLAKGLLNNPVEISVAQRNIAAANVDQIVHPVDKARKPALLSHLIHQQNWSQALVFCKTKHGADRLVKQLYADNIHAAAIHGNKSQSHRTKTLAGFKDGEIRILVATDIAARGIDIHQLPQVVNFDLPNVPEDYVHRIGRTGRAGSSGQAISLVCADEIKQLRDIERFMKRTIDRLEVDNFSPSHSVPTSTNAAPEKAHVHNSRPSTPPNGKRPLFQHKSNRNRKPNSNKRES